MTRFRLLIIIEKCPEVLENILMINKAWEFLRNRHNSFMDLYNGFFPKHPHLEKVFFTLGSLFLLSKLTSYVPPLNIGFRFNMQDRYGARSWVVVTGGSDGIGKEFAL
jgi:17beta-estradiol 17-dehydrogenase / very-long-chain 3-oxoacyl-CoA reductase